MLIDQLNVENTQLEKLINLFDTFNELVYYSSYFSSLLEVLTIKDLIPLIDSLTQEEKILSKLVELNGLESKLASNLYSYTELLNILDITTLKEEYILLVKEIDHLRSIYQIYNTLESLQESYDVSQKENYLLEDLPIEDLVLLTNTYDDLVVLINLVDLLRKLDEEIVNINNSLSVIDSSSRDTISSYSNILYELKKCPICFRSISDTEVNTILGGLVDE